MEIRGLKTTFKLKDRYGDWWLENHFQTEGQVWRSVGMIAKHGSTAVV
jgi:hypothetical protein